MNKEIFIPKKTREEMASPAPEGYRHEQAKKIVFSLIGQGLTPEAVFMQVRAMYDPASFPDEEIRKLIAWAQGKNPQPCGFGCAPKNAPLVIKKPKRPTPEQATAAAEKWLGELRVSASDLWQKSPWQPTEDWRLDALMLFAALYYQSEHINVITAYTLDAKGKANPQGLGKTMMRDEWMKFIRDHGIPEDKAGAWVRFNPVTKTGTGEKGGFSDADVTSHRFTLIESDVLPAGLQLSLWASLPLPVAAIIESGGKSSHAWVQLDCASAEEYQTKVARIHLLLARFGVDPSNKNASRLSRLPGARRTIGKCGDGEQRLLYLNPEPSENPIFERSI